MLVFSAGCGAEPRAPRVCPPEDGPLIGVVTSDFEVGALAAVDPADDTLYDSLASAWPDAIFREAAGAPVVIGRDQADALRVYADRCFSAPEREVPLPEGTNAHDLVVAEGSWFVSAYDGDHLLVLDPAGGITGEVDLSAWAADDGTPEPDQLVAVAGEVVVALQNLLGNFDEAGPGRIAVVSPTTFLVDRVIEVGPNPKIFAHPVDASSVVVLSGLYFDPSDGALSVVDVQSGVAEVLATEATLGVDLSDYAEAAGHGVVVGVDPITGSESVVWCIDHATRAWTEGPRTTSWLADLVGRESEVWVVARSGLNPTATSGVFSLDPITCSITSAWLAPSLEPYSVVVLP